MSLSAALHVDKSLVGLLSPGESVTEADLMSPRRRHNEGRRPAGAVCPPDAGDGGGGDGPVVHLEAAALGLGGELGPVRLGVGAAGRHQQQQHGEADALHDAEDDDGGGDEEDDDAPLSS